MTTSGKKNTASKQSTSAKTKTKATVLQQMGLVSDVDLVLHLPIRYEDHTRITMLRDVSADDVVQIEGEVVANQVTYRGKRQLLIWLNDGSGHCLLRFFNFYPNQQRAWAVGSRLRARGEVKPSSYNGVATWTMLHPSCSKAAEVLPQAQTPIYSTVAKMPQARLRQHIAQAWQRIQLSDALQETIPAVALQIEQRPLLSLMQAVQLLHYPAPDVSLAELQNRQHPAWTRLKAEELLAQQLSQQLARQQRASQLAPALRSASASLSAQFLAGLAFKLTAAQQRVVAEINADLALKQPMNRLLQGDVGSGKTVVAALAALTAIEAGWQAVLMVPTELLAQQHVKKISTWLQPLGVKVACLLGSQKAREKRQVLQQIAAGEVQLIIGTHAVIQEPVRFAKLGLVIIDEQHRFGVAQRLALIQKMAVVDGVAATEPHFLMMTATPIPRTLAMSFYADLDISSLDELPPGRKPILTKLFMEHKRPSIIAQIARQIAQGEQVYWVCPLIEESEALDLANATDRQQELAQALPQVRTALLHSKVPAVEKQQIMDAFAGSAEQPATIDLLVATTVVEVGVDVPNASLMVIEHAERFGLSQLHQLRGRVGRGSASAICVLLYGTPKEGQLSQSAKLRLKAMLETQDGFEIARRDLQIRGPGDFIGARQSGVPMLKFADLQQDMPILEWARTTAMLMLQHYPALAELHMQRWHGEQAQYLKV